MTGDNYSDRKKSKKDKRRMSAHSSKTPCQSFLEFTDSSFSSLPESTLSESIGEEVSRKGKRQKPNLIDIVRERGESQIDALQTQVEELTSLIKTVIKGKQKAVEPDEAIIDWKQVDSFGEVTKKPNFPERSRSRERSRSPPRSGSRSFQPHKSRSRERSRSPSKSGSRSFQPRKSRYSERSRSPPRSGSRYKLRSREGNRSPQRSGSRSFQARKSRSRERNRSPLRSGSRSFQPRNSRSRERNRSPPSRSSSSSSSSSSQEIILRYEDINKDQRNVLRSEIIGILDRLPESAKLDVNKTFEEQSQQANKYIIPVIQKALNKKFSVADGVVKHVIHERHRHQRENFLNSSRSAYWNDNEKRRKHANSRRNDKRERRAKTINKLLWLKDSLVKQLYEHELNPILHDNLYHSPEMSETDDDNEKRKIVVKDLRWRSSTLRTFLREYIDSQAPIGRRTRTRFLDDIEFAPGEEAPINAPSWTKVGYNGSFKKSLESYTGIRYMTPNITEVTDDTETEHFEQNDNEARDDRDNNEAQEGQREESQEDNGDRRCSIVSKIYDSDSGEEDSL